MCSLLTRLRVSTVHDVMRFIRGIEKFHQDVRKASLVKGIIFIAVVKVKYEISDGFHKSLKI